MRILNTLSSYWNERRQEAEQRADRIAQAIQSAGESSARISTGNLDAVADQELVTEAITNYRRAFDKGHGGFSTRPKFPPHGALRVLTYEYQRTGNRSILPMITRTLDAMWMGGMHDHIGGGFHRYSTDSVWLLPHFEKMLYDNAQLMRAYTDAYVLIGTPRYRAAVDDIFRWVEREMTSPEGAFYSAIDSGEVGKEGEVYVWHYKEILEVLGDKDGKLFAEVYNIGKHGNFREEATGEASGTNIVHLKQPLEELANAHAQSPDAFKLRMAALREKLLARRNTWVQPHKDDKILTSWNGLMIGALAHAGARLNEPTYTQAASKAADFILKKLVDKEGRQLRTYRNGEAKLPGYLDDYAYLAEGLLELYSATGEKRWLVEAKRLADAILREFEDKKDGAFFFTADSHENLLMRSKSLMGGGNVPTPNGVAVLVLLELNRITGAKQYETAAERTLEALAGLMWQSTRALDSGIHATAVAVQHRMAKRLKDIPTNDADANQKLGPVTAHLFASNLIAKPGGTLRLALALDIGEGWHLYGPNPNADFLIPTQVKVLPGGSFTAGKIKEPQPRRKLDPILKQILSTYENRIWYFMPITIKDDATEGEVKLIVQVKTQACDQTRCLQPRTDEISLVVKVSTNGSQETRRHPTVFFDVLKAGQ